MSGLNQIIAAFFGALGFAFLKQSAWERDILYFIRRMSCMVRVSFGRTRHPTVWETIFCSGIIFRDLCGIFCSQDKGSRDIISCGRRDPPDPGGSIIYDDAECI